MTDTVQDEMMKTEEKDKNTPNGMGLGSIVLLASIVIAAVIVGIALLRQNQVQPTNGPAPTFGFTTFDGETFSLEDFRGQVVVLNFWASWCGPCAYEAPDLQYLWEEYEDDGVVFIGIAYADNGPNSLRFLEEYGITYYNAPDVGTFISELYNIQGVPETFIIDQNGEVTHFFYAPVNETLIRESLDPLIAGDAQ